LLFSACRSMSMNHSSTLTAEIATIEPRSFCFRSENPILISPSGQSGCSAGLMRARKFSSPVVECGSPLSGRFGRRQRRI
jgi:hypothetical protein